MLEVTIIGNHAGSQALGEVRPRLVDGSSGGSSQMVCRATFNLTAVLGFGWSFIVLFQYCMIVMIKTL